MADCGGKLKWQTTTATSKQWKEWNEMKKINSAGFQQQNVCVFVSMRAHFFREDILIQLTFSRIVHREKASKRRSAHSIDRSYFVFAKHSTATHTHTFCFFLFRRWCCVCVSSILQVNTWNAMGTWQNIFSPACYSLTAWSSCSIAKK